ncbi:MAG: hypothetical protein U0359_32600 [Byssovorax sp.]
MPVIKQIALGASASCVLDDQGQVWQWGTLMGASKPAGVTPSLNTWLTDVVQIAVGGNHACALRTNGRVRCWGENDFGQLGTGTLSGGLNNQTDVVNLEDVVQVSCGNRHSCALRTDGTVWCWGQRACFRDWEDGESLEQLTPYQIPEITDAIHVSTATETCALGSDDQVKCWGFGWLTGNDKAAPKMTMPSFGPVARLEMGDAACVLLEDYKLRCWPGALSFSSDGLWSGVAEFGLSGLGRLDCAALRDGSVRCAASQNYYHLPYHPPVDPQTPMPRLSHVSMLAVGGEHACAIDDGCMKCWGMNHSGQIGNGTTDTAELPTPVHWLPEK